MAAWRETGANLAVCAGILSAIGATILLVEVNGHEVPNELRAWAVADYLSPDAEDCQFRGVNVACVQHWVGKPDTTTLESPAVSDVPGDPALTYDELANHWSDRHITAWPPRPEPGREQYLTPFEETLGNDYRPFTPLRMCADGTMWDPARIPRCPDGNTGSVGWVHQDGTRVTLGPNSPTGVRWNGGEIR